MSKAIAFLAGMGAGWMDAKEKGRRQQREDERDARERAAFDAQQQDRTQAQADKQALRDAAAPTAVDAAPVAPPIGSRDEPRAPEDQGIRAGGKTYTDRPQAEAAAAAYNDPTAQRGRISAALIAQGKMVEADQLATNALTNKANQIKVDAAQREEANSLFDDGVRKALATGGWDGLAQFMSDSHADGKSGAVKFQAARGADGKVQIMQAGADGASKPFGPAFDDTELGRASAGLMLSRGIGEDKKVQHMLQVKQQADASAHQAGVLKVQQQQADTTEQFRRDQAENMRQQRNLQRLALDLQKQAAAAKPTAAGTPAPLQVSLKDMRDFEADLGTIIKDQFPVKDGGDKAERTAMANEANSLRSLATSMFTSNAQVGIPLTAGMVNQAVTLARDRANIKIAQVNGVPHEGVMVNGTFVLTSGALQKKPSAPTAAPPAAAPAGAASARAAAGVAPQAAAAQPAPLAFPPQHAAALAPLVQKFREAGNLLAAAGTSGDPRATKAYAPAVNAARDALAKEAVRRLGPDLAESFMSQL